MGQPARRIVAIVTTYRPGPDLITNVARIGQQVDHVVIVDDGSGGDADRYLADLDSARVKIVRLPDNQGIASALNAGVDASVLAADDLIVTFDQDSSIPDGFVAALVSAWDVSIGAGVRVGMVAPSRFAGVDQTAGRAEDGLMRVLRPIQSGTLISAGVFAAAGPFRRDLFIDLVDVEYYLRLVAGGWQAIAAEGLDLPHELGRFQAITVLGRTIGTGLSSPFRYYYRARNRLVVNRAYRSTARAMLRTELRRDLTHLLFVLAFARGRGRILSVIRAGIRDARAGRMGRIPEDVERRARDVSWRGVEVEHPSQA